MDQMPNTARSITRSLRRRELESSASPRTHRFVQDVAPILSSIAGPVAGVVAASKGMSPLKAGLLGGSIALAGGGPRALSDVRHYRQTAQILKATQPQDKLPRELNRNKALVGAGLGTLAGSVLGSVGAGMKPGVARKVVNTLGWGTLLPAIGTLIYLKKTEPKPTNPVK